MIILVGLLFISDFLTFTDFPFGHLGNVARVSGVLSWLFGVSKGVVFFFGFVVIRQS